MALTKVKGHIVADDLALGGNPTTTTQSAGNNTTRIATTAFVTTAVANLVDGAPSTLNTLDEIAAALNDDAALNTTLTNSIAAKLPLAGGSLTGGLDITASGDNLKLKRSSFDDILLGIGTGNSQSGFHITNTTDSVTIASIHENAPAASLVIDSAGDVGIGTTSPDGELHVLGTGGGNGDIYVERTSGAKIHLQAQSANGKIGTSSNHNLGLNTNGTTRITIDTNGQVGIGETSPLATLHIKQGDSGLSSLNAAAHHIFLEDTGSNGPGITFASGTSSNCTLAFGDSDSNYVGFILYDNSEDAFKIGTNAGGEDMRIDSSGRVGINRTPGIANSKLEVGGADNVPLINVEASGNTAGIGIGNSAMKFYYGTTERLRIDSGGGIYMGGRTNSSFNNDGVYVSNNNGSFIYLERSAGTSNSVLYLHRRNGDGSLIDFYESNTRDGYIHTSSGVVSLVGFGGAHDSSGEGISSSIPVGTVLSTIDEEHKEKHAKVKVSDSVGDKRVYGVFQEYKEEEESDTGITHPAHAIVAAVGIGSVRVTGACEGGDLLESNGDGTAKVQSDDIIKSKTIGKVTIGNSDTSVKLVSCVLYCG